MFPPLTRRDFVTTCAALAFAGHSHADESTFRLSTFSAEVTPPLKHPLMGGGIAPAAKIDDPLFVLGVVLHGGDKPLLLAAVDWCELRNDAYDRWREILATGAATTPERVLLSCVHQHDTPIADLEAQRLLDRAKAQGAICDLAFHEKAVQAVGKAVREGVKTSRSITHVGIGAAKVEKVASNRRVLLDDGKVSFGRMSATRDEKLRDRPEGTVDPFLKTLSFWDGEEPVAALSCYATHPMSFYGRGGVSSDFVGLARKRRQADDAKIFQLYFSGCSGNITAGKYNDGNADNRPVLAERIYQAMVAAWKNTKRHPLKQLSFTSTPVRLEPRDTPGFTVADLTKKLADPKPFNQCLAALGLSWRKRADAGHKLVIPVLDLGAAQWVLMPGESYVEYQLLAQQLRPDSFVVVSGYGECATGYVPTEKAVEEGDSNLHDWCWVAPGAEKALTAALGKALGKAP